MQSLQSIQSRVHAFRPAFNAPSFSNFSFLLIAWLTTPLRRTVTGLLRSPLADPAKSGGSGATKHFSVFHRFFSRANWNLDALGKVVLDMFRHRLGPQVTLIVDDTLCRRSGPRILGAGMFHDPLASSTSGAKGKRVAFAFGLNFVVLSLWVEAPMCHSSGIAVPILFRLYRSKRTCPEHSYRKRTQFATELIGIAASWLEGCSITLLGDAEYACKGVLASLPQSVEMIGPLPMNAQLHAPEIVRKKRGRPSKWGARLASPKAMAADPSMPWRKLTLFLYGSPVTLLVKTTRAVWKSAGCQRVVTVVLTRDPKGRLRDACLFHTCDGSDIEQVLQHYARRWELEVCFRNVKQHLGLEEIANGFTRRKRRGAKKAGPQADRRRAPIAASRTGPFAFIAYALVVAWYLDHGNPREDIARAKCAMPWYRHKSSVSFSDMHLAFKRSWLAEAFPRIQQKCALAGIPHDALPEWIMAA